MVLSKAKVSSNTPAVTGTRVNGVMASKTVKDSTSTQRIRPLPNQSGKMARRRTMLGKLTEPSEKLKSISRVINLSQTSKRRDLLER